MPPSDDKEKVENEENEKNDISDTKSNKSDKSDKSDKSKDTPKKGKGKKGGDKMDPARFQEGGVSFKAKLIGVENVPDARGDKMCQDAMQKLKGMVKTAKAHKPKITVNVSLEGLKIIDEISQNVMHHHAVHKISFISRDITDARAFGYIYGLGEGKHQFFGIKTDKPAEGLVLTLRDLFQVVFEMKKQEVEAAKARKTQKDEKSSDADKSAEKASDEKPAAQESAYDGGRAGQENGGEKKMEQSASSANLLDLENQLLNLEVTFEQVDAFSDAAAPAAAPAAAAPQFPVSFDQSFGSQPAGAQRDPFATQPQTNAPLLAPPPTYGTQQQQQKQPMQQQQQQQPPLAFPQPQADPFKTDAFGQPQFGQPTQPAQAAFANFPPQGQQPPSPQQSAGHPSPGAQATPPQQRHPQQQQQQQQAAFGAMPVQSDPFKDDPFFTQQQPQDRYAVFNSLSAPPDFAPQGGQPPSAQAPLFAGVQAQPQPTPGNMAALGAPLQPAAAAGGGAPSSPKPSHPQQAGAGGRPADAHFSDLGSLADFTPTSKYVDRTQFFKPREQPKPSLDQMVTATSTTTTQVGTSQLAQGTSPRQSRNRPRPAQSTADPFGACTDPFGSAPFTQPSASFDSQEPDPFDTSAILAKTHFQGPFDTSELKPSSAAVVALGSRPTQSLDVSASSSTPPTTRSDKVGRDGTTSSNVSTPEDFSLPSPELPPPPLPRQGTVEIPEQAPAPPPRPSFSSSSSSSLSRPSMSRQATVDVGAISRSSGRSAVSAFSRQVTVDFAEDTPPALPPRPPSSGPTSQPLSFPETPPPQHTPPPLPPMPQQHTPPTAHRPLPAPQHTPPPLPKHDAFHSHTLPRQHTLPAPTRQSNVTVSRQTTLATTQEVTYTPPVLARDKPWNTPPAVSQQDQFTFPPFEGKKSSTPPPFQAFTKPDPFSTHATPPGSPLSVQRGSATAVSRQLSSGSQLVAGRQDSYGSLSASSLRQDSHSLGHPSPTASPTLGVSPSPTGTSMVARPRPRPRPRTPGGPQQSPTLSQVPENAKSPPVPGATPPSSRATPPSQVHDPFSRDVHMRHSERLPPTEGGFSRDAFQRQSDRTDIQVAGRRVDSSSKGPPRSSLPEPVFSVLATETITLPPENPKEESPERTATATSTASTEDAEPKADPFPEGVDPFVDDSPIDPFSENDPFNKDITQQAVAFRTKAIGSKDSESVKGSTSDPVVEDPFANDPFFTSGGKGTPVVSSPALGRQGRKTSRDSVRSEPASRSRTASERSNSGSQQDSTSDPFSVVPPIKRADSTSARTRSDTSSVHSSTTPDPFVVDWSAAGAVTAGGAPAAVAAAAAPSSTKKLSLDPFPSSGEPQGSGSLKDQSNVSSASDLAEGAATKPTNGSDPFDTAVNGVSDSDSTRTDSASLHSDPFASLDPFKFALGGKKPEQSSWPTMPSGLSFSRSDSPQTQSPFRDPFIVDTGASANGSSQADFGDSRGGREAPTGSSSIDDPFSSSSSQPPNGATPPMVPARQFQGNPFASQNQAPIQPNSAPNPFNNWTQ